MSSTYSWAALPVPSVIGVRVPSSLADAWSGHGFGGVCGAVARSLALQGDPGGRLDVHQAGLRRSLWITRLDGAQHRPEFVHHRLVPVRGAEGQSTQLAHPGLDV